MKQPEPKTLILDIESSLDILAAYGLKEQYHRPENILQDWYVICFAWRWLGGSRIYDYSIIEDMKRFRKADDYHVIKRMHEVISDCEVMVGHNVDKFDWKKFMARVIYHGLPPMDKPVMVDTLKEARKIAAFTSNSMKYLSKYLKITHKPTHSGDMWLRILRGDKSAVKECVKYCRGDIETTEALYKRLLPYMTNLPNRNLWRANGIECCPKCGSENVNLNGTRLSKTGRYNRYSCQDCAGWFQGTKAIKKVKLK